MAKVPRNLRRRQAAGQPPTKQKPPETTQGALKFKDDAGNDITQAPTTQATCKNQDTKVFDGTTSMPSMPAIPPVEERSAKPFVAPASLATVPPATDTSLAVVRDMFGGDVPPEIPIGAKLPIIEVMRETPQYRLPDGNLETEFEAHIILWRQASQMFFHKFGEGEAGPPDCYSSNGRTPEDDTPEEIVRVGFRRDFNENSPEYASFLAVNRCPVELQDSMITSPRLQVWFNSIILLAEVEFPEELFTFTSVSNCSVCPANAWASELRPKSKGKACKNSIFMWLLLDGYKLPTMLKASPASLGNKGSLVPFLTNAVNVGLGGKYQTIRVRFTLETKSFSGGNSASCIYVQAVSVLDPSVPKDAATLVTLGDMFKQAMSEQKQVFVDTIANDIEDVGGESESEEPPPF